MSLATFRTANSYYYYCYYWPISSALQRPHSLQLSKRKTSGVLGVVAQIGRRMAACDVYLTAAANSARQHDGSLYIAKQVRRRGA